MENAIEDRIKISQDMISKHKEDFKYAMIAGGFPLAVIQKVGFGDIDLFFSSQADFDQTVSNLEKSKIEYIFESAYAFNYEYIIPKVSSRDDDRIIRVQLIKMINPFQTIINDFDIMNSMCYMRYPFDEVVSVIPKEDLHLITPNQKYEMNLVIIERIIKYHIYKKMEISDDLITEIFESMLTPILGNKMYDNEPSVNQLSAVNTKFASILNSLADIPMFNKVVLDREHKDRIPFERVNIFRLLLLAESNFKSNTFFYALSQARDSKAAIKYNKQIKEADNFMMEHYPWVML